MEEHWWPELRNQLVSQFRLGPFTAHDQDHWKRVEGYGCYLGAELGADLEVVRLFAWIHDSQREQESRDPEHGARAAAYAAEWCGKTFFLKPEQLDLLTEACSQHELGLTTEQVTIGVCWDSDRLDLDRVGKTPDADYLSTNLGRKLALMRPSIRRRLVGMD
jgi:uncharacterized protein